MYQDLIIFVVVFILACTSKAFSKMVIIHLKVSFT